VEPNSNLALKVSQRGYVIETGNVIVEDTSEALRANTRVRESYLGG
jgi:branched-chain amino acid transport system ATP-binding protein